MALTLYVKLNVATLVFQFVITQMPVEYVDQKVIQSLKKILMIAFVTILVTKVILQAQMMMVAQLSINKTVGPKKKIIAGLLVTTLLLADQRK